MFVEITDSQIHLSSKRFAKQTFLLRSFFNISALKFTWVLKKLKHFIPHNAVRVKLSLHLIFLSRLQSWNNRFFWRFWLFVDGSSSSDLLRKLYFCFVVGDFSFIWTSHFIAAKHFLMLLLRISIYFVSPTRTHSVLRALKAQTIEYIGKLSTANAIRDDLHFSIPCFLLWIWQSQTRRKFSISGAVELCCRSF